jgi:uncharacterized coiled-coil protein SlyX
MWRTRDEKIVELSKQNTYQKETINRLKGDWADLKETVIADRREGDRIKKEMERVLGKVSKLSEQLNDERMEKTKITNKLTYEIEEFKEDKERTGILLYNF